MNCKYCGAVLNDEDKFCNYCGNKVESNNNYNEGGWQQSTAQEEHNVQNQQYQFAQPNQQYQTQNTNQQYGYNQQQEQQNKKKDRKVAVIVIILAVLGPLLLLIVLVVSLGIFIFVRSNNSLIVKDEDLNIVEQEIYNSIYDTGANQSIDNPPSVFTSSGTTVKLDSYYFTIPQTIEAKASLLNTKIELVSKDKSWVGELRTASTNYNRLKENKTLMDALIASQLNEENEDDVEIGELRIKTINGREYLMADFSSIDGTGIIGYSKLASGETAIVAIFNIDGTTSTEPLNEINKILDSAKQ